MLRCRCCQQEKPLECFRQWEAAHGGQHISNNCFDCVKANAKARRKKWADKNPKEHIKAYTRCNWRKHGIVFDDDAHFDVWFEKYYNATHCQATGFEFSDDPKNKMLCKCLDHDHKTGRPRGIICGMVNLILGKIQDSPEHLRQLASYIEDGLI